MYIRTDTAQDVSRMSAFPAETPIGMTYVPYQKWETPYPENIALEKGTMFPSLDLPFLGKEAADSDKG